VIGAPKRNVRRHADRDAGVKSTPLAGSRKPFKAAIEFYGRLKAAEAIADPAHRALALSALPPLRSRGHGGKHRVNQRQVLGRTMRDRSKYKPRLEDRKHAAQKITAAMTAALVGG
jgi:hypothetical protein